MMQQEDSLPQAVSPTELSLTLRDLQRDAIGPLLLVMCLGGVVLAIVPHPFPQAWQGNVLALGLLAIPFFFFVTPGNWYLFAAWLMVLYGLASGLAVQVWLANTLAAALLALPVGFAVLFISVKAGLLGGIAASLASLWIATGGGRSAIPGDWVVAVIVIWGSFVLAWIWLHPIETAIHWSWQSYAQARQQLERARDHQAELKQALKDLSEANLQMARLNQLLSAARRAAEESERVKAEFVANVSHELRTPLNMIIGFAEMIANAPATYGRRLPPALLADVAAIHRNSQHLASLINDVLDISQVEARRMTLSKEWVSLAEIVEAAVVAVQPLFISRGLYLRVNVPADLPLVYCDRTRIRQVLLNLLSNACRFTETGGVTIDARLDEKQVIVTVTDTGPGIAESDLPKVFEPFRQLDGSLRRRQGGSGLGLNISRRFIELHGGQMGVRSQVGEGSSFWFSLPLTVQSADVSSASRWLSAEWEPRRRSTLTPKPQLVPRIIVLEPQGVLQDAISRYLDGVQIEAAETPAQARALLAAGPAQVLLVRGESPEQTSAWVDAVRATPYGTPVVACSLPVQGTADALGIAGYLVKPITRSQLFEAIESLGNPVRSILLADDDTETLQLFGRILSSSPARYRVLQASSGQEALALLRARKPDLLLLDLVMPGMDGFAVLAEKRKDAELRNIPVLVISALDPGGQPIIAPSLLATRSGGLSLPDFLRAAMALSEVLAFSRSTSGSEPPGAPRG